MAKEAKQLEKICKFGISVYIQNWFLALNAASVLQNDLFLVKEIYIYKTVKSVNGRTGMSFCNNVNFETKKIK